MANNVNERTSLLNGDNEDGRVLTTETAYDKKNSDQWDNKGLLLIRLILASLTVFIISVLGRIPLFVFSFHPFFMTIFIIFITEGIATLQPTQTPNEKRKGLKRHTIMQLIGFIFGISGFSVIFYNKVLSNKSHFTSTHGILGVSVISYLSAQIVFGLVCAYVPGILPAVKKLWKFHRLSGYLFLSLVWITAIFGVKADYIVENNWLIPSSILLSHWSFSIVVLVILGVGFRIRPYKLKGQLPQTQ